MIRVHGACDPAPASLRELVRRKEILILPQEAPPPELLRFDPGHQPAFNPIQRPTLLDTVRVQSESWIRSSRTSLPRANPTAVDGPEREAASPFGVSIVERTFYGTPVLGQGGRVPQRDLSGFRTPTPNAVKNSVHGVREFFCLAVRVSGCMHVCMRGSRTPSSSGHLFLQLAPGRHLPTSSPTHHHLRRRDGGRKVEGQR